MLLVSLRLRMGIMFTLLSSQICVSSPQRFHPITISSLSPSNVQISSPPLFLSFVYSDVCVFSSTLFQFTHSLPCPLQMCRYHLPPLPLFPSPGTFLLSGGEECVLVVWQLALNEKHFRPRLGAPITRVSCAPADQNFAVSLQNNSNSFLSQLLGFSQ